jgi:predicted nucleic acid-binding Zn ribbon protein
MKSSTNVISYNSNGELISLEDIADKTASNTEDVATLKKLLNNNGTIMRSSNFYIDSNGYLCIDTE